MFGDKKLVSRMETVEKWADEIFEQLSVELTPKRPRARSGSSERIYCSTLGCMVHPEDWVGPRPLDGPVRGITLADKLGRDVIIRHRDGTVEYQKFSRADRKQVLDLAEKWGAKVHG